MTSGIQNPASLSPKPQPQTPNPVSRIPVFSPLATNHYPLPLPALRYAGNLATQKLGPNFLKAHLVLGNANGLGYIYVVVFSPPHQPQGFRRGSVLRGENVAAQPVYFRTESGLRWR